MAAAAGANQLDPDVMTEFLDKFIELDDAATAIMTSAMKACKDGPRKDQKELRVEMKQAGVRMRTFNALAAAKRAERMAGKKIDDLEDDDRSQLEEVASAMKGTPFGDFIQARLDTL